MPYKPSPDRCGIYKITSPSGKIYIGSSINVPERINKHRRKLNDGSHHNKILLNSWKKYHGDLKFEQILICRPEDLLFYEQLLIDNFKPEYNLSPTASNISGYKHTEETKAKLRKAWTTRPPVTNETKKRLSVSLTGIKRSGQNVNRQRNSKGQFIN